MRSCAHKVHTPIGGRKDGRTDRRTDRMTESQKPCPSAFLRKGGGQKIFIKEKLSVETRLKALVHTCGTSLIIRETHG